MKRELITTSDGSHSYLVSELNETYHSKHGAISEAKHVFIKNGLLSTSKTELNILEIGFGTGLNVLLTKQYAEEYNLNVYYQTLEPFPLTQNEFLNLNFTDILNCNKNNLIQFHECNWGKEIKISVNFIFIKNNILVQYFESKKKYDLIYFDAFAPKKQAEIWSVNVLKKMYLLLKLGGLLVTYCAKGEVKRILKRVGFIVESLKGPPGKREMIRAIKK